MDGSVNSIVFVETCGSEHEVKIHHDMPNKQSPDIKEEMDVGQVFGYAL